MAVDLVDRPGGRKTHSGEIPVVGGLAMFLGLALGVGITATPQSSFDSFVAACSLLVTVGLLDDRFDLSPWLRLPAQIAATLLAVNASALMAVSLGSPAGDLTLDFSGLTAAFVVVVLVVGAVNAFNMLDGMDGLAGTVSLVALVAIAYLSFGTAQLWAFSVSTIVAGAVAGFLLFNVPSRFNRGMRCFMGDAGSTLIGFVLALLCLRISQGSAALVSPITVLWFVALPIFELLWTIIRRVGRGHSPFRADREHLHHLLLDSGFGVRSAFAVFLLLASLYSVIGLVLAHLGASDSLSFVLFGLVGVGTVCLMYRAHRYVHWLPSAWQRPNPARELTSRTS